MKDAGAIVFDYHHPRRHEKGKAGGKGCRESFGRTDAKQVHLVAHSMGGLDGRYYISTLGGATKVATLVTIGTPPW